MALINRYFIFLIISFVVMWNSPAFAEVFTEADTLRGIKEFGIMINNIPEEFISAGLTEEKIRGDIELKLRLAGIKVLPTVETTILDSDNEDKSLRIAPHLDVYFVGGKWREYYLFSVQVSFNQMAKLEREPNILTLHTSYDIQPTIGLHRNIEEIRKGLNGQIDEFLNTYLSVNPKDGKNKTQ